MPHCQSSLPKLHIGSCHFFPPNLTTWFAGQGVIPGLGEHEFKMSLGHPVPGSTEVFKAWLESVKGHRNWLEGMFPLPIYGPSEHLYEFELIEL